MSVAERGCGNRKKGGFYLCCPCGPGGLPLEHFLVCPVLPLPGGYDIVNKATVFPGPDGVNHVLIWVGEQHYPHPADFYEEVRMYGASRRIPANFPFESLTPGKSKMFFYHPKALTSDWERLEPANNCPKNKVQHTLYEKPVPALAGGYTNIPVLGGSELALAELEQHPRPAEGPCLGKCLDLTPATDGSLIGANTYVRHRPSRVRYHYTPSNPMPDKVKREPGLFLWLPIAQVDHIQEEDGSHNKQGVERAKKAGFKVNVCKE